MTTKTPIHTAEAVDFAQVSNVIELSDTWRGQSMAEARHFVRDLLER